MNTKLQVDDGSAMIIVNASQFSLKDVGIVCKLIGEQFISYFGGVQEFRDMSLEFYSKNFSTPKSLPCTPEIFSKK